MNQQIDLLRATSPEGSRAAEPAPPAVISASTSALAPVAVPDKSKPATDQPARYFGPYKPLDRSPGGGLTPLQQEHLDNLIAAYIARTPRSKASRRSIAPTSPIRAPSPVFARRGRRWSIRSW